MAKYSINDKESDGKVVYDSEEGRYGCEFNPPTGAKNFVATIVGGGGGGAGAEIAGSNSYKVYASDSGVSTSYTAEETAYYEFLVAGAGGGGFSADLKVSPNNKFYYSDSLGTPSGTGLTVVRYVALKSPIKSTAPDGQSGAMISGL